MSFSTLRDIEECPRRWALRRATYAFSGEKAGYPQRLNRATVAGTIVHTALERVIAMMRKDTGHLVRPDSNNSGPKKDLPDVDIVIHALRALGGISNLLGLVLDGLTQEWASNPRVQARGQELEAEMRRELPSLREQVKHLLQNIEARGALSSDRSVPASSVTNSNSIRRPTGPRGTVGSKTRGRESLVTTTASSEAAELGPGLHSEVPLFNAKLDWFGKVDLIRIAENACSIVDFKTGAEKEDHHTQVLAYALLWIRDKRANPRRIPVTELSVVYGDKTVMVEPPDSAKLRQLEKDLEERACAARETVTPTPPPALPSREACEWCDVRQLCSVYWNVGTRQLIDAADELRSLNTASASGVASTVEAVHVADLELSIKARQGEWSWHARILQTGALTKEIDAGTEILLRARPGDQFAGSVISPGTRVRVVGAYIVAASEESANRPVAVLGRGAEVFRIP